MAVTAPAMACHRFHPYHCSDMQHHANHAGPSSMAAASHSYAHRRPHAALPSSGNRGALDVPPIPPFFGEFSLLLARTEWPLSRSVPAFPDYVVDRLVETVTASLDPAWRADQSLTSKQQLRRWVETLIGKSRCRTSTVLLALAYLDKARPNLRVSTGFLACERALIGSLTLANKVCRMHVSHVDHD